MTEQKPAPKQELKQSIQPAQKTEVKNQVAKKVKPTKKLSLYSLAFFSIAGAILLLAGGIEWQRSRYTEYVTQRDEIVSSLLGDTTVTQEQVKMLNDAFLSVDGIVPFIEMVEKARPNFEKFDIKFISDVPEGKKQPMYLPVEFKMQGSYENIVAFLDSLYHAPYAMRTTSLEISSKEGFYTSTQMVLKAELYVDESFKTKK